MFSRNQASAYYEKVGSYYDTDAPYHDRKSNSNEILQKIRQCFRRETEQFSFSNALEIGFGAGTDLVYFAQKYPQRQFYGVDVSQGMYDQAMQQIQTSKAENITIRVGNVEAVPTLFPEQKFDLIYVYFGALNTVSNLAETAAYLKSFLAPNGKMVITVINKWYLAGILLPLLKGKTNIAFQRIKNTWRGYSPQRFLESKCYTPGDIKKAFHSFRIIRRQGYSILYPAWYDEPKRKKWGWIKTWLWKADRLLNHTPFRSWGEYNLFVLEHR